MYSTQRRIGGKDITNPVFMHTRVEDMLGFLVEPKIYQADITSQEAQGPVTVTEKATSTRHHARAVITGKAASGNFLLTLESTTDCLRTS
jgi:hypothetical protein